MPTLVEFEGVALIRTDTDGGETARRYHDVFAGPGNNMTPEDRLRLSILKDAIFKFVKVRDRQPRIASQIQERDELIQWFVNYDADNVFSFGGICDRFGINAASVRDRLFQMPADELRKMARNARDGGMGKHVVNSNGRRKAMEEET